MNKTTLIAAGLSACLAFTATSAKTDQLAIDQFAKTTMTTGFAAAWLRSRGLAWAADMLPFVEDTPLPGI